MKKESNEAFIDIHKLSCLIYEKILLLRAIKFVHDEKYNKDYCEIEWDDLSSTIFIKSDKYIMKPNVTDISFLFGYITDNTIDISGLSNWNLSDVKSADKIFESHIKSDINMRCPKEGSFIGYKLAKYMEDIYVIVKLEIPKDALRSSSFGIKCRCSKAKVLDIHRLIGDRPIKEAFSMHDPQFRYIIGKTVHCTEVFDPNRWNECSSGIHFFMSIDDLENYYFDQIGFVWRG